MKMKQTRRSVRAAMTLIRFFSLATWKLPIRLFRPEMRLRMTFESGGALMHITVMFAMHLCPQLLQRWQCDTIRWCACSVRNGRQERPFKNTSKNTERKAAQSTRSTSISHSLANVGFGF
jgi:hypothetical protein